MRHWADVWHGVVIMLLLAAITLLACLTRSQNSLVYHSCRYLYILPIIATAYFFDRTATRLVAFVCTALFGPALVDLVQRSGLSSASLEMAATLLFYNLFASLTSGLIEFDRRQHKIVDTVERLGELIGKSLDLGSLLQLVLGQCRQMCDADGAEILHRQTGDRTLTFWSGQRLKQADPTANDARSSRQHLLDWLMERSEVTTVRDLADDPRFDFRPRRLRTPISLLAVPLLRAQEPAGVLALWRLGGPPFHQDEAESLRLLTDKSQMAIENAWLYTRTDEALATRASELSILLDTSNAVSSTLDLDELLQILCQKMIESAKASFCSIYLLDHEGQSLTLRASASARGTDPAPAIGLSVPIGAAPWHQRVIVEGEPLVSRRDIAQSQLTDLDRSLGFPDEANSALLIPLLVKGRVLGAAALGEMRSWDRSPFEHAKIELCQAMARQGALAVENMLAFESIARQSHRMQLIIDNVADGVFSTDLDRRIVAFNPAAEKITGYRREDVIGRSCAEVFHATSQEGRDWCSSNCPLTFLTESSRDASPVRRKEWITRSDGKPILVLHSIAPLIDQSGETAGLVSVIRDISREEELVRLKSEFISLVSHQLRTPLASISASSEILTTRDLDHATRQDVLGILNRQCLRLTRLTSQVLEASSLEEGRLKPALEPLSLAPLIRETVAIFQGRYPGYLFTVQAPDRPQLALGDKASTEVVLDNLLQNAVNYSPDGSRIDVAVMERNDIVVISVADEGVGIPADEVGEVFHRFHRLPNADATHAEGFGLGLYIARTLVEAQGGTIWAESEAGKGSRFHFSLQRLRDPDEQGTGD
jgi:PAS domain S-box-containing protein